jgi:hypothetical protein
MAPPILPQGNNTGSWISNTASIGGNNRPVVAGWEEVQWTLITSSLDVGVLAYHTQNMNKVEFQMDRGTVVTVNERTLNTRTNVEEYVVRLDPASYNDRLSEIRARCVPIVGKPVIKSLFIYVNAGGTLPNHVRYVSPSGNDGNTGLTSGSPFATISKACDSICAVQGGRCDGGTVYLLAGSHEWRFISGHNVTTTETWVTITSAPGLTKDDVKIVRYPAANSQQGIRSEYVRLLDIEGNASNTNVPNATFFTPQPVRQMWFDDCRLVGRDRGNVRTWCDNYVRWATNIDIIDSHDWSKWEACIFNRDVRINGMASDAFSNCRFVVNCTVKGLNSVAPSHPDFYQWHGGDEPFVIIYNSGGIYDVSAQGIFGGTGQTLGNVAIDRVKYKKSGNSKSISFDGPSTNMLIERSSFVGATDSVFKSGLVANGIVFKDVYYGETPPYATSSTPPSGVTIQSGVYGPMPIRCIVQSNGTTINMTWGANNVVNNAVLPSSGITGLGVRVNGGLRTISSHTRTDKHTTQAVVTPAILDTDDVKIEYDKAVGNFTDASGKKAESFWHWLFVENNSTQTGSPGVPPNIITASFPNGTVNVAYSSTLTATGDTPITWALASGSLPAGLSLNTGSGEISGTPTTVETANFSITATGATSPPHTKPFVITIGAAPVGVAPTITTSSLPNGTVNVPYSSFVVANGDTPITWSIDSGALPAGLQIVAATGEISGTPTGVETASFDVKATNSAGNDVASLSIEVVANPAGAPTITTASTPNGRVGAAYSVILGASGDTPITWSIASGSLPANLELNATTGEISGTPSMTQTANFSITATNASGSDTVAFTISIAAALAGQLYKVNLGTGYKVFKVNN